VNRLASQKGVLLLLPLAVAARAQAPASADLWRLSAASLAGPAALEAGATAAFWNPAAAWNGARAAAGAQVLETPDVLGVGGLIVGLGYRLSGGLATQLLVARTDVGDLIRTTTSPSTDLGDIPVYEQMVGVGLALRRGAVTGGGMLRVHNARFDTERDDGLTLDVGARATLGGCAVAAATHFFPVDVSSRDVTDFYAGAECHPLSPGIWGAQGRVFLRYGVSARRGCAECGAGPGGAMRSTALEHTAGVGLELDQHFRVDVAVAREVGYAEADWRPVLGVWFNVGRYVVSAARASGLGGLGATYRIGLDVDVLR
jgi:hypothetical protein